MNENSNIKVHWGFWGISAFMLVWNLIGCINFVLQFNPEMVSSYRETEQAIIQSRPLWATVAFGVSVFGGAIACVLLMLKRFLSFYIFVLSLVGSVIAVGHSLTLNLNFGTGELVGIVVMPIVVSVLLILFAWFSHRKGWVNK